MRILRPIGVAIAASVCVAGLVGPSYADTNVGLAYFRAAEFAEAQLEWRAAAAAGDPVAALYLGVSYDTGEGLPRDETKAVEWYRQAAEEGNATAAFNLGVLYDGGSATLHNPAMALRWYTRAAELGSPRADYNLGLLYEGGVGDTPDRAHALHFFEQAARHGIAAARAHLLALGQPISQRGAALPAEDGRMHDFQLAQLALVSRGSIAASRAAALFRRAAEAGNALAAYDLAYCFENGLGVPTDRVAAYHWYVWAGAAADDGRVRELASNGALALRGKLDPAELRQASLDPENR
jgi:TPR repeat protein